MSAATKICEICEIRASDRGNFPIFKINNALNKSGLQFQKTNRIIISQIKFLKLKIFTLKSIVSYFFIYICCKLLNTKIRIK